MNSKEARRIIEELSTTIQKYNKLYYESGESPIEDQEFDLLMEELLKLESEWPELKQRLSPTQIVGGGPTNRFANVKHQFPMLSLSNIFTQEELEHWYQKALEPLSNKKAQFVCELKIDGLAISLKYEEGKFVQAVTRGDGEVGDDVTENVKTITSLPLKLSSPFSFELRGEIYFTLKQFNKINQFRKKKELPAFKNPRNAAAGTLRMKDPEEVKRRGLELFVYDVVRGKEGNSYGENMDHLSSLGFPVHKVRSYCTSTKEILDFCNKWEKEKELLPFEIDGAVIKIDRFDFRSLIGNRTKSPRWATAWKFRTSQARSKLIKIEDSIGRTGTLTPVAILEPVELLGTTVRRASLYNYNRIKELSIYKDDVLVLEKGGEIIPKIVAVDYSLRVRGSKAIVAPDVCPSCKGRLEAKKELVDLYCINMGCPAIVQSKIEHFVSKKGMDIRTLGPALIQQLIKNDLIQGVLSIYNLESKQEELSQLPGLGGKSLQNLFAALEQSRKQPLHRVIFALGIPHIGEKAAKMISYTFGSIEKLLQISKEDLISLADFGPIMSESLYQWVNTQINIDLLQGLLQHGINPQAEKKRESSRFENQTLVITGTLKEPRKVWEERLESLGFKVSSSLSSKTNFLLAGENPGSKIGKAKKLNITISSEEEILQMIQKKG